MLGQRWMEKTSIWWLRRQSQLVARLLPKTSGNTTWTRRPGPPCSLPQARGLGSASGRELHLFGGADINRADKGDHWVLSPDGGTEWCRPASPIHAVTYGRCTGGKLYAIGGQHGVDHDLVTQKSVHVWRGAGTPGTWTAVAGSPEARSHIERQPCDERSYYRRRGSPTKAEARCST